MERRWHYTFALIQSALCSNTVYIYLPSLVTLHVAPAGLFNERLSTRLLYPCVYTRGLTGLSNSLLLPFLHPSFLSFPPSPAPYYIFLAM